MRTLRRSTPPLSIACALLAALALSCSARRGAAEGPGAAFRLESAWDAPVADSGEIHLAAAPGGFVSAAGTGAMTFFEAASGRAEWTKSAGTEIAGSLVIGGLRPPGGDGTAPAGWAAAMTRDGDVVVASLGPEGKAEIRPLGWPGAMLTAWDGGLLALDPKGALGFFRPGEASSVWELRLPPLAPAPAAACGGIALLGTADGRLVAIRPEDGSVVWRKSLGSPLAAPASCDTRHAYAATADNVMHALRLHKHSAGRMWKIRSGADPAAAPVLGEDLVALLSEDTYLYGFNRRNGHLRFRIRLDRRPGPVAVLDDVLFVAGTHVSRMDAYRLPAGRQAGAFTLPVGGHFVTQPVVSGDHLAIGVARYGESASILVGLARAAGAAPAAPAERARDSSGPTP